WQVFGTGGIEKFIDMPVTEQFTACEAPPRMGGERLRAVKSAFRTPERFARFGLHRPRVFKDVPSELVWRAPDGEEISEKMNRGPNWMIPWKKASQSAYMNHYPLRSLEAYIIKKHRGRANHVNENLDREYFDRWNLNAASDKSIQIHQPAMKRELAGLLDDAQTRELHDLGVAQFRAQLAELLKERPYRTLYELLRQQSVKLSQES
ncbi:MAG: hypothetical protein ACC631_01580, partial [Halocynthiibacter sp.]